MALPIDADQLMRSLSRSKVRSRASMDPEMLAAMKTLKNRVTELRQNPSPDQDLGSEFSWGGELSTARSSATTDDRRFTSTLAKIDGPAMTSRLSEGAPCFHHTKNCAARVRNRHAYELSRML